MKLQILLAEDNYPDALYFRQMMERTGIAYELHVCEDGDVALHYLLEASAEKRNLPDVVFLDINLPKRSGLEVLEHLRNDQALRDLNVVVITGSDDPDDLSKTSEFGASYIQKPADFGKLLSAISKSSQCEFDQQAIA